MATPTTVDTMMRVAMIVTMVAMTTARLMTAPTLIRPADNDDDVLASVMKVAEGFRHSRAADAREWPAWYIWHGSCPSSGRAKGRSDEFDMRRKRPAWHILMTMLENRWLSQEFARSRTRGCCFFLCKNWRLKNVCIRVRITRLLRNP
eukprot:6987487-Pyramimonas_sp.AAC.1